MKMNNNLLMRISLGLALAIVSLQSTTSFAFSIAGPSTKNLISRSTTTGLFADNKSSSSDATSSSAVSDPNNEIISAKISLEGDVDGGYYRACVLNEAGKFRRLVGTMTPPEGNRKAEIYVEGKKKMVEGFIRWCQRGNKNVGLCQLTEVTNVEYGDEILGLYEEFYCRTK